MDVSDLPLVAVIGAEYGPFMLQRDFEEYMELYAETFDLYKHMVFNTTVKQVVRNADGSKWRVEMIKSGHAEVQDFDKPKMPVYEGQEQFEGLLIYLQQFCKPEDFKGKKVVLVGLSATLSDILSVLVKQTDKAYISHCNGALIIGRWRNGMSYFLQSHFPNLSNKLVTLASGFLIKQHGKLDPSWRLLENMAPLSLYLAGCIDNTVEILREGKATSLYGIQRFLGGKSVEFTDGTVLDNVDAVICCTGYSADFDLIPFIEMSKPETDTSGNPYGGRPIARLYKNLFPPAHADSIAVLAYLMYGKNNGFSFSDVTSMAISNIWRGVSADMIPSRASMERAIDKHQQWIADCWTLENRSDLSAGFLHEAAGTGMENLGWGWRGWVTWLKDPYMSYLMNHGVETAHAFRYFETGKRKTWDGAREAIVHTNMLVRHLKRKR
ncbi:dimethylaniline monooxygenase 2 [Colletotrichum cereale]|nr:dimethylaniline monooxygenase 2 [Colletotrichum cereale]